MNGKHIQKKLKDGTAIVGVIGLGYVGLPLAIASANAGFKTIGFDMDEDKVRSLNFNRSYIDAVQDFELSDHICSRQFQAQTDFSNLNLCDVIIICVPTPLSQHQEPDLSFVKHTFETILKTLRPGQLISLESTTYPGTTLEIGKAIVEREGLKSGIDFFLGYSPERQDPGNANYVTATIPKVVSGDGDIAKILMKHFYKRLVSKVVTVSSTNTAEAVKITENIFRSVNIALVNELKIIFDRMNIDIWEVIEAASSKPFGYMPFYPGPGLGGHCIPIDPFYLTWKAREYKINTKLIELAGQINTSMPDFVLHKITRALDKKLGLSLGQAKVLVVGLSYKKNVSDIRESPSLRLLDQLLNLAASAFYHDPYVEEIPQTREYVSLYAMKSEPLKKKNLKKYDAVLIATDHDTINYRKIAKHSKIIIDTRNVMERNGFTGAHIVKA